MTRHLIETLYVTSTVELQPEGDPFLTLTSQCPAGGYRDILAECEIIAVMALLLVPAPQRSAEYPVFSSTLSR